MDAGFITSLIIVVSLVVLSGTFAGLTLSMFGIKLTTLERKIKLGDKRAKKVYQIRKYGNRLLCTLLLGNVASYTIMSIYLGSITTGVIAGFIATSLIFVFGEIVPQAVFPRYALEIGARLSWLVKVLLVIFYPVAAPLGWILNKVLGEEAPVLWTKKELEEIIKYHEDADKGIIDKDEERIVLGALSYSDLIVHDIMIWADKAYWLKESEQLTHEKLAEIRHAGHGKIPVVGDNGMSPVGIIFTKDLIGLDYSEPVQATDLCRKKFLFTVHPQMKLDNLLNLMVQKKMQMVLVVDEANRFIGIATLEDVMEEILKLELEDHKR